jgi:DNA invertase Pin-like site-specific DNA recombinase
MTDKLTPAHLALKAYVYVRQSTQQQVRTHHESRTRQYALADRARQLGFAGVVVIDEDLGRSGSGLVERPGFGQLLTAICQNEAGAVLALEASRLARNNRDWHHLLDLCAMTGTLLIDDQGMYDPRDINDRLVLGLQGTMSEFELSLFRQRARQAFEQKVGRGHAMWEIPVGFVRTDDDRVEVAPDRRVQEAVAGVFRKFRELGSARQTMLWYRDENILVPRAVAGTCGREVVWRLPTSSRIRQMLTNPTYAGALAYGRTATRTVVEQGRARQAGRRRRPRDQWKVLILDNHAGYISWEDYLSHLRMLEGNASMRAGQTGGAARDGGALLSGLLRCGRCGRQMVVGYSGNGGNVPRYLCQGGRVDRGSSACQTLGAHRVDEAVCQQLLEAVQPAGVQASLDALEQLGDRRREKRQSLALALEQARYEVDRARRQYDLVDPANRLVAGELEGRWDAALSRAAELERQLAELDGAQETVTPRERERLLELGRDLPTLWGHPAATAGLKKRLLRAALQEVVIADNAERTEHVLVLHWQGGVHTELRVKRTKTGQHRRAAEADVIALVSELSKVCTDQTIAATLNRLGYRTGTGKTWRAHSVVNLRHYHRLPNYEKGVDWLTIEQAAAALEVSHTVIRRLIAEGTLPATQVVPLAPRIIARESLSLPGVRAAVEAVRAGRQPRKPTPGQREFPWK